MFSRFEKFFFQFVPAMSGARPELRRRAELIVAFSYLGLIFGVLFASFYLLIEHNWGAGIILLCCILFPCVPYLLRQGVDTERAGNYYCAILLAGFISLSMVEGGIHRHAVAWLVTAPMVAHLLISGRGAVVTAVIAFCAVIILGGAEAMGYGPPATYPPEWDTAISITGYSALAVFLFALGMLFQQGLRDAQRRTAETLEALADANSRLTRLNEEKSEFLGIAAHDLKNPLAAVIQCTESLATNELPPDRVDRAVAAINKEAKRMRRLVSDLLDLHAIEEGRTALSQTAVILAESLQEILRNTQADADRKKILFTVNIDPSATALADEKAVAQVVENLLSNAIKFSAAGGAVGMEAGEVKNEIVIVVKDNGPGFTPEDLPKLFGRFTRLSARPTGGESSHGLGLSIVKRLVDAMGGQILCRSELGKGAIFTVVLPKATAAPSPKLTRQDIERALAAP